MATCIFGCEAPVLSTEHIFSRAWIARLMPMPGGRKLKHTQARIKGQRPFLVGDREQFAVEWESSQAGLTVKGVCTTCNNGWMDRMDTDTYPHLERMVRGEAHALAPDEQRQIARWLTKIGILFDTQLEHPALTPQLRARFRQTQEPFPDSHIWLGRYELPQGTWRAAGSPTSKSADPERGQTNAYLCTIVVNHLLAQLLVPLESFDVIPYARTLEQAWGGYLRPIWPPPLGTTHAEWPPPMSIRPHQYADLATAEAAPG